MKVTNSQNRREFIRNSTVLVAGTSIYPGLTHSLIQPQSPQMKSFRITKTNSQFEREPLAQPFGFKGSFISNVWQPCVYLETENATKAVGPGTQSPLWCDSRVFLQNGENGSNALMYAVTVRALNMLLDQTITSPISWQADILDELHDYACQVTGYPDLKRTFTLNALVPVDNALWILYQRENNLPNFDAVIPEAFRPGLSARHDKVASIPALSYNAKMDDIRKLADHGFFIMKIKIGAPGTPAEMLAKDQEFMRQIHETIGHYETPHTVDGKIPYYFDANGRYTSKEHFLRFLDYAEKIGTLDRIAVLEEPFPETMQESVNDITERGPRVASDESAHTDDHTRTRIEMGYNTIAVKAVAKTMSMTMKIAQAAYENNVPCFCADLTVPPLMADWNKNVAARLPALGSLQMGLQETNGWQNYRDWNRLMKYHPLAEAPWTTTKNGVYQTGEDFYQKSGGIFDHSEHYDSLFRID